ncbi:thiamine phosphate synthase [Sutterella sp.]|uniref:thiamine phosphate synthase n=1 Tax=Sutterella sp. TaxID=1981025 RepID=UPI003FD82A57
MRLPSLTLYVVLDPDLSERSGGLIPTALAAVRGGASILQLRAPAWKKRCFVEAARALKKALAEAPALPPTPLIIDDHADVMLAAGADGLHVGQDDLPVEDARRLIGAQRILGLSAGSLEELGSAPAALVDYYGVGAVYSTQTKKDAGDAIGLGGLRQVVEAAHAWGKPCVAIGGIHLENAADVARTGVDGAAVISAVCGRPDPEAAARALLAQFLAGVPRG